MSHAPGQLVPGQWTHVAVVAGPDFSKLYGNGQLLTTFTTTNGWTPASVPVLKNFLGRSVVKVDGNNPDLDGQMAEVRLWAGERTGDEIQANLFNRLTGRESELLALWNFADGTARDASPHGRDGALGGAARITESTLPTATTLAPWSRLILQITDRTGTPLPGVNVRAEVKGVEVGRATSDARGETPLSIWTTAPAVDLVASGADDLGGWQLAVPITRYTERTNEWKLGRALEIGGRAVALDGRTPQPNLVVELVQPPGGGPARRDEEALSSTSESQIPESTIEASFSRSAGSAATNRVLRLDGSANSFVELPTNLLASAREMTFEAWLKWGAFGYYPVAFDIGGPSRNVFFVLGTATNELFGVDNDGEMITGTTPANSSYLWRPGTVELRQWIHVAGVASTNGMRLYVNGDLVATNAWVEPVFTNGLAQQAFLGRALFEPVDHFRGEMDDVRLWRTARTAEQIRDNLSSQLTGSEAGLVGLWNFDDPANPGRDSSSNGHHGTLMSQATITNSALPVVVSGNITDASGDPLAGASVELHQASQPDRLITANAEGVYSLTIQPGKKSDLFVTDGERSAYRLGFQPGVEARQRLDWVLMEAGGAESSAGGSQLAAAPNRVLELDGKGSYVELPLGCFSNLAEITVEGWVNWSSFQPDSHFFEFGGNQSIVVINEGTRPDLGLVMRRNNGNAYEVVPGVLSVNLWQHMATVVTTNSAKLYVNGIQVLDQTGTNLFPSLLNDSRNYLGACTARDSVGPDADFHGLMDDVRVWKTARTAGEIRSDMFTKPTGREPGLMGLWDFDDPANPGKDSSTNRLDGKLIGPAIVTNAALPLIVSGTITDAVGKPLTNAVVEIHQTGQPDRRAIPNTVGEYSFTMNPSERLDLFVTTGELSAYRLGFQTAGESQQRLDWVLTEAGTVAAPVNSAPTSGVLNLPGEGSYAELPPNIFAGLTEATVEGWTRWSDRQSTLDIYKGAIEFGRSSTDGMYLGRRGPDDGFPDGTVVAGLEIGSGQFTGIRTPFPVGLNEWIHWAFVTGPGGMELYVNGTLAGTNVENRSFAALNSSQINLLGKLREEWVTRGQMAELRVWQVRRTAERIRDSLGRRLTGNEPGLVGLWSFDDPALPMRDRSPNGYDGQLLGQATITNAVLPVVVFGNITDSAGRPLTNAVVEIHQTGQPDRRATANTVGEYSFTMNPTERCDLFVTNGELSAYRLGFQPGGEPPQRLDWVLTEAGTAGSSPAQRDKEALTENQKAEARDPKSENETSLSRSAGSAAASLGPGTVVATVLTDERGEFKFPNVPPGAYQLRAQIPGGRAWYEAGRILFANPDPDYAQRTRLANLEFPVAPFNKGRWKKYGVLDGLKNNNIGVSFFGPDGALWNYAWEGLVRFDGSEFLNLSTDRRVGGMSISPLGAYRDDSGQFWMGTSDGLWRYQPDDGSPASRFPMPGYPDENEIIEITGTTDGAVWVRTPKALARYLGDQGTVFTNLWRPDPSLSEPTVQSILFPKRMAAAGHHLWLTGPGAGLIRFDGTNHVQWTIKDGLPSDDTGTVTTAPNGDLWFVVGAAGVVRFDGTHFFHLTQRDGLPSGTITAIHISPDQRVWFGTANGTVVRYDGQSFAYFDSATGTPPFFGPTLMRDWFGVHGSFFPLFGGGRGGAPTGAEQCAANVSGGLPPSEEWGRLLL